MVRESLYILIMSVLLIGCGSNNNPEPAPKGEEIMEINLTSTAFEDGGIIPPKYTADGENVSPPLVWTNAPDGTKSFALICDDPDAPVGDWVHWVIYDLPSDVTLLPENVPSDQSLEGGAVHGLNDFGRYGYGGPAPPSGTHRYFFKLYALDTVLNRNPGLRKNELLKTMEGHILAKGQLMGRYSRR